jgi:hypothetical protein
MIEKEERKSITSFLDKNLSQELVNIYDICGRQLYRLCEAWGKFPKSEKR